MINKNTHNTNLLWKPNWVNHQYFLLLQNCYLQIVFLAFTDKDGITPYLPATTGRSLRPLDLSATTERMLQHPINQLPLERAYDPLAGLLSSLAPPNHPYMIIPSLSYVHLWISQ